jgi:hypothetical protein
MTLIRIFATIAAFTTSVVHAQTFTAVDAGNFPAIYNNEKLVWIDVDNDNDQDLMIHGSQVSKFFKNNAGTFTEFFGHNIPIIYAASIATADFNNDGFQDLIVTGFVNQSATNTPKGAVYLNNGGGIFTESTTAIFGALYYGSIACADIDLDGDVDFAIMGRNKQGNSETSVYVNNGDLTFTKLGIAFPGAVSDSGGSVSWGDFDKDGDPDLLLSGDLRIFDGEQKPVVKIFRNQTNNGSPRNFEDSQIALPQRIGESVWIDADNDNDLDVLVSGIEGFFTLRTTLLINTNNVFQPLTNPAFENVKLNQMLIGDFNNDGKSDIMSSEFSNANKTNLYINSGTGLFTLAQNTGLLSMWVVAASDFDDDGDIDVAVGSDLTGASTPVKLLKNNINNANTSPPPPTGLLVNVVGNKATFNWSASTDVESGTSVGYMLSVGTTPGSSDIVHASVSAAGHLRSFNAPFSTYARTEHILNEIPGGTYYARIQSVDKSSNASGYSNEVTFTVGAGSNIPAAPSNVSLSILNSYDVLVQWIDQSGNEDGFDIYRGAAENSLVLLNSVGKNLSVYTDKTADYATKYFYSIKAKNSNGSLSSPVVSITTPQKSYFKKITALDVAPDDVNSSQFTGWVDFNADGFEDLYFGSMFAPQLMYAGNGTGAFARITTSTLSTISFQQRTSTWGDYDNDGDLDVYVTTASEGHLYRNDGAGVFFEKVSFNPETGESNGAAWVDYDNDGWLDLSVVYSSKPTILFHNNKDGSFTRVTANNPIVADSGFSGIYWCDYDNDGWQDCLVIAYGDNSVLYHNNGGGKFNRVTDAGTLPSGYSSISVSWADFDADGDFDFALTRNTEADEIYENKGNGKFALLQTVITEARLMSNTSSWGDFDNDGNIDLMIAGQRGYGLFRNTGNKTFERVTSDLSLAETTTGISVAWGDMNKDGFLDLAAARTKADNLILKNNGNANHWISLKLVGTKSNRAAIGSRVSIKAGGKWQHDYISSQTGSRGQNSLPAEFGLAGAVAIDSLVINWSGSGRQVLVDVAADQFKTITEPIFENSPVLSTAERNVSNGKADLTWTDPSTTETGFIVERSISNRNLFKKVTVTAAGVVSFSDSPTVEGDSVFYRVLTLSADGGSIPSNVKGLLYPINKPGTVVAVVQSNNSILITWGDQSSVETSFEIERSLDVATPAYTVIKSAVANSTSFTDDQTQEETAYLYRVNTKKGSITSEYTAPATAKSKLLKPTNVALALSSSQAALSWTDNSSKETAYIIERSAEDNLHFEKIGETAANATSFSDASPLFDKVVYYRVKAKSATSESAYSDEKQIVVTGIESIADDIHVYPNPASERLVITNHTQFTSDVEVLNDLGLRMFKGELSAAASHEVIVRDWSAGIYLVRLRTDQGQRISRVMIRN